MSTLEKTITAALEPVVTELIDSIRRVDALENTLRSVATFKQVEDLVVFRAPAPARDGDKGEKGEQGERGEKGEQGQSIKGDPGEKGDKGDPGEKGDLGEKGERGEKGDKGDKGDTGEKGERGEQGLKGDPGEQGEKGFSGDRGEQGEKGERGINGERGERGEQGVKGDRGDDGLSIRGEKGDPGEKGERGEIGLSITGEKGEKGDDGISIEAVELGEGEFDLIFSNKDRVTLRLPPGIKGEKGDTGNDGQSIKGERGEQGDKGEKGDAGVGISAQPWIPGVYREGSVVQYEFGRYYTATRDTASVPGEDVDWLRVGKSGFRWRGLKKEGTHYEHGDFFIDNGSTFLVVEDKPRMFAQRGKDGVNGTNGMNGKDGASVVEMVVTPDGELILTRSDGDVFVADIRPMLVPVIEKMVQVHLASLNVIIH